MLNSVTTSLRLPNFFPSLSGVRDDIVPSWAPDRYLWTYQFADGELITPLMSLLRNGGLGNTDLPNERRWSFEGEALRLHREDGTVSAMFCSPRREGGRLTLTGLRGESDRSRRVRLTSRRIYGTSPDGERSLCAESTIRCPSRTLLVVFNSGGSLFDGTNVPQYDFFNLSTELSVDLIRFAEHEGTFARFLDKTALVLRHIESALAFGYRKIILLGLSAGSYIAIHMATILALHHPELAVSSVIGNGQLMLDDEAEEHLLSEVTGEMLSPIWSGSLDHVDFPYCNIDVSLRRNAWTGARHVVIYDSGNAAEAYHSGRLAGLPGVDTVAVDLGLSHATGIHELCRRGIVVDAVRRMMAT